MTEFFVYADYRADNHQIFYVGKGTKLRVKQGPRENIWWKRTHRKYGSYRKVLSDGLQEWAAHEIERDLIALHGRKDLSLGSLVNLTDGGDGHTGMGETARTAMSIKKTKLKYIVGGVEKTLNQISKEFGVKRITLTARLAKGWSIEDAIGKKLMSGSQPSRMVSINGEDIPLLAIAETMGIKSSTLRRRLACGMGLMEALAKPIRQSTRWHGIQRSQYA